MEFRGPSVTRGYFRNPEATHAAFHDGWMDSGDLGCWADGELYITGRQKDLIIKAGRSSPSLAALMFPTPTPALLPAPSPAELGVGVQRMQVVRGGRVRRSQNVTCCGRAKTATRQASSMLVRSVQK